ncbi:MAG: hypothetical protein D5R97_08500 [Candidatus Syntrophonatronum acetioxidans]|uniref:WD40 repeat domain-containing protein n=1 Tax=Candidatus Syntrophonatronum acetioxidans TaxID=1795816 RepID=A0A424YAZ9_9FIRM|nr:MAG: hypothetical protein D5R97_08500 [Candidatus Syntrophonatronum acetioxidans]
MKKILLAGFFIIMALALFLFYGKISHLPWEGLPGTQPREIWVQETGGGEIIASGEREGLILVGRKNQGFSLSALDYQGNNVWEKSSYQEGWISLGEEYWSAAEYDRGSVEIFDYQGSRVNQVRVPSDFKEIWVGPAGEVISLHPLSSRGENLENFYGERLLVSSPGGRTLFNQAFPGQGFLEVKIIPGREILILNMAEVYPQAKSKIKFMTLKGETLMEIESGEMFLTPRLCLQEERVFLAARNEFYVYSFTGEELASKFMDFEIADLLLTGQGEVVVLSSSGPPSLGNILLKGINRKGQITWEKKVPGAYQQSQERPDGGFYLLTGDHLYLFYPQGETYHYFSREGGKEFYPLGGETFFTYDGQKLKAYHWPLSPEEKERAW